MIRTQCTWAHRNSFSHSTMPFRLSISSRCLLQGGGCGSCFYSGAFLLSVRFVQYEQTSATLRGMNKKDRTTSTPWITKSTKDYMSETDTQVTTVNPTKEKLMRNSKERKARFVHITEETDRVFDTEMDRMRDYNVRRWKKGADFFKRQGVGFTVLYISAYLGCLVVLYVGFATGIIKKETAYEFMFFFMGGYVDKEWFYKRVEAWDTYVNFGFAFVINEMLEIFRFPFMIYTFYTFRPYLTGVNRRVKTSMFRWCAAES